MKRGPMSQLPLGFRMRFQWHLKCWSMLSLHLESEMLNRIARDSWALEEEVQAKSPRGPYGTKSRPCLVSSVGGHHLKDL